MAQLEPRGEETAVIEKDSAFARKLVRIQSDANENGNVHIRGDGRRQVCG